MKLDVLIETLQNLRKEHGDIEVMVPGYEGGYHNELLIGPEAEEVILDVHEEWYYGPHESPLCLYDEKYDSLEKVPVLVIGYVTRER